MKQVIVVICILALTPLCSSSFENASVRVHNAWIRPAPPNAKALAAYMLIKNDSHEPRTLTGVSCELFKRIEIHQTEINKGIAKMIPQKELIIPAGKSVVLEPGGYHLMLINPKNVPHEGEQVDMELHFDNGQILHVNASVRAGGYTDKVIDTHQH